MSGTPIGAAGNIERADSVREIVGANESSASLVRRDSSSREIVAEPKISEPKNTKQMSREELIKDLKIINGLELPEEAGLGKKISHWFQMTFNKSDAMRTAEASIADLEKKFGIGVKAETIPIEIMQKTIMPPKVNPDTVESAEHKKLLNYFAPPKGSVKTGEDSRKLAFSSQENSLALLSHAKKEENTNNIEFVLDLRKAISKPVPDQEELRNIFNTYLLSDSNKLINILDGSLDKNRIAVDSGNSEQMLKAINESLEDLNNCFDLDQISRFQNTHQDIYQKHEDKVKTTIPPKIDLSEVKNESHKKILQIFELADFSNIFNNQENSLAILNLSRERYNSESIEFFLDLRNTFSNLEPDREKIKGMFNDYLLKNAPKEANLPYSLSVNNENAFASGDTDQMIDALNKSSNEIMKRLISEHFPLFKLKK